MARPVYVEKVSIGVDENEEMVGMCINMHSLALMQEKYGRDFDLRVAMQNGDLREIGELVRILLEGWRLRCAPERPEFTLCDAYNVMDNMGGLAGFSEVIVRLRDSSLSPDALALIERQAREAMEGGSESAGSDPTKGTKAGVRSKSQPSRPA